MAEADSSVAVGTCVGVSAGDALVSVGGGVSVGATSTVGDGSAVVPRSVGLAEGTGVGIAVERCRVGVGILVGAGVGVLVGFTIQYLGRGIESKFTVLASILAVVGCILGNVFTALILTARAARATAGEVLSEVTFGSLVDYAVSTFQLIDIVYWALAIWAASYFAKRPLTREQGLAVYTYESRLPSDGGIIS